MFSTEILYQVSVLSAWLQGFSKREARICVESKNKKQQALSCDTAELTLTAIKYCYGKSSVRLSVRLWRWRIGWNTSKIISELIILGFRHSADPNIRSHSDLLLRSECKIIANSHWVWAKIRCIVRFPATARLSSHFPLVVSYAWIRPRTLSVLTDDGWSLDALYK